MCKTSYSEGFRLHDAQISIIYSKLAILYLFFSLTREWLRIRNRGLFVWPDFDTCDYSALKLTANFLFCFLTTKLTFSKMALDVKTCFHFIAIDNDN
jgi:hypothetical protein